MDNARQPDASALRRIAEEEIALDRHIAELVKRGGYQPPPTPSRETRDRRDRAQRIGRTRKNG